MSRTGIRRMLAVTAAFAMACGPVAAQEIQVVIDRSLTDDPPYTAIYPEVLQTTDDGNPQTILTLRHPEAPLQCDVFVLPDAPGEWNAEAALASFDVPTIEAAWAPTFPGFHVTARSVTRFASGPALLYEGASDGSPFNVPVATVHAEAVANGRTYAVACLAAQDAIDQARPLVDFIIANFSTNSEGQCCVDPADDRG
jgi:hypothetical protein